MRFLHFSLSTVMMTSSHQLCRNWNCLVHKIFQLLSVWKRPHFSIHLRVILLTPCLESHLFLWDRKFRIGIRVNRYHQTSVCRKYSRKSRCLWPLQRLWTEYFRCDCYIHRLCHKNAAFRKQQTFFWQMHFGFRAIDLFPATSRNISKTKPNWTLQHIPPKNCRSLSRPFMESIRPLNTWEKQFYVTDAKKTVWIFLYVRLGFFTESFIKKFQFTWSTQ